MRLWQGWNPQDAEEFHNAFAEILNANDRRTLAPHLAECGFIRWMSSHYAEARRSLIESRVIHFDTLEENPYLSSPDIFGQHIILPINLLFLGEWGEALREFKDVNAKLDKNVSATIPNSPCSPSDQTTYAAAAVALRTASESITRVTPLIIMLTPTKVPIAQTELDGHCR